MKLCVLCVSASAAYAQLSSTVSLNNGVRLQVTASLGNPTGEEKLTVEMARASGDSFYRIFWDQNHLAVFAYELEVALLPDGSALRAIAKPAGDELAARYPNADAGKPVPTLSTTQELGPLASGQSATLGLFEIPGMGLQVSEKFLVRLGAEDRAGALRFSGLRISSEGKPLAGPAPGGVAGRYAMFYIPGRGAFFFSTEPVPGHAFVKAGTTELTRMRFTIDNVDYEVVANAPIQGVGGEVWVLHDAGYKPVGNWTSDPQRAEKDQFFMAASDTLGWWLP
ncbi:MAG: hypothetical protein LAO79_10905 [Acidobacteriia bacterium]|nr:hypothetical protein [Terriglobia bacterium]